MRGSHFLKTEKREDLDTQPRHFFLPTYLRRILLGKQETCDTMLMFNRNKKQTNYSIISRNKYHQPVRTS